MSQYLKKYWLLILPIVSAIMTIANTFSAIAAGKWYSILEIIKLALLIGGITLVFLSERKQSNRQCVIGFALLVIWLVLGSVREVRLLPFVIRNGLSEVGLLLDFLAYIALLAFVITQRKNISAAYKDIATTGKSSTGTSYLDAYKNSRKQ